VDLAEKDQQWVGSLTAPQIGFKGAPLTGIAVNKNEVEFGLKAGLAFKGQLGPDGVLKGEYKQGGNPAPFVLKRVGEARVDFPEPSTLISKEVQGEWKGAFQLLSFTINTILKLPGGGTPAAPGGELQLIEWGNSKAAVTLWKQDGDSIFFLVDNGMSYEGEFHQETREIAGTLRISFLEIPLSLRLGPATPAAATAAAPPETK
jgi:hypothetical protein